MTTERGTVIVGGSVAGVRIAQQLRRLGHADPITLVDGEPGPPHDKPALSKQVLTEAGAAPPVLATPQQLADLHVDHRPGTWARGLDTSGKVVLLASGERLGYRRLAIATGASARRLRVLDGWRGVHHLRSAADAVALAGALRGRPEVVVVGGGFIGLEVAAAARALGLGVTVVEAGGRLLQRVLPSSVAGHLQGLHEDHGVGFRLGSTVVRARGTGRVEAVELSDGTTVGADVVVVGIGAVPTTAWLEDSPLRLSDGVVCTETLQVEGAVDVWAAGDVARWRNPRYGVLQRVEHWTAAREQAVVVAANMLTGAAHEQRPCAIVPYSWSDQYDCRVQHVGVVPPGATTVVSAADRGAGRVYTHLDADGVAVAATTFGAPVEALHIRRRLQDMAAPVVV